MKPTVVICPGAWQLEDFFQPLQSAFEELGYPTVCKTADDYPDYNPANPPKVNPDTAFLREYVLKPLVADGKDVVLFMHSYGGIYGPSALEGLGKSDRQRNGMKGGVIAAVFTAAFVAKKGTSAMTAMGFSADNVPDWVEHDKSSGLVGFRKDHAKYMVFHDLPEGEAERLASKLPKQPYSCFSEPVHWDPYDDEDFQNRLGYIHTESDRIIPFRLQRLFTYTGGIKHTLTLKNCSHSPHIEIPKKLAETTVEMLHTLIR